MPVYACLRGDCSNLATLEPGCFVLADATGREWLCYETDLPELTGEMPQQILDMLRAQLLAHKHGHSAEGSTTALYLAADRENLARQLVFNTYPPWGDSAARLSMAGWELLVEQVINRTLRVVLGRAERTVEAEGANRSEVWYRAAQKALEEVAAMSTLTIHDLAVPLRDDGGGGFRVGKSRVSLDVVVREYKVGASPEGIRQSYPTLDLADLYAVLAYYLRYEKEVEAHLARRREQAVALREEIEARQSKGVSLRETLRARRAEQEQDQEQEQEHASSGN